VRILQLILFGLFVLLAWYCLFYLPTTELADFSVYREAARALLRGEDIYGKGFGVSQRDAPLTLGYLYPPLLAVILSWGEALSPGALPYMWCALLFCVVVLSAFGLGRLVAAAPQNETERRSPISFSFAAPLFLLLWPPLWDGLMWGQVNPLVLSALIAAAYLSAKEKDFSAGACLAFGTALKVTPLVLLIPFVVFRRWKGVSGFVVTSVILALVSAASPRGVQVIPDFLLALKSFSEAPMSIDPYYDYGLQKLMGMNLGKIMSLVFAVAYGAALILLRRNHNLSDRRKLFFSILLGIPLMVLVSPCVWFHHLLWLVPPLLVGFSLWGYDKELKPFQVPVFLFLAVSLGLSLYLHVLARHHFHFGEMGVKVMVPFLIFSVFLCVLRPLLSHSSGDGFSEDLPSKDP
jgi:hypothetical protein